MSLMQRNTDLIDLDHEAILKSLNLNPRDPKTQALLLVCDRYNLDPILKHMVLISGNPYVTRDGLLHVAHRSGQLDGIEVVDFGEAQAHYWAKVAVYRRDMTRPFTYVGRFPKSKPMAKEYGPEMAIKTAEVHALRRAFSIAGLPAAIDQSAPVEPVDGGEQPSEQLPPSFPRMLPGEEPFESNPQPIIPLATDEQRAEIKERLTRLKAADVNVAARLANQWKENGIRAFGRVERFTVDDATAALDLIDMAESWVTEAPADPEPAA